MEQPRGVRHSARMSAFGTKRTCRHVCACPLSGAKQTSAADRLEIAIYEMHLAERSSAWDTWIFLTFHGCHSLTHEITHNRSDALLRRAKWKSVCRCLQWPIRSRSALPPIPTKLMRPNELPLCAKAGREQVQQHAVRERRVIRSPRNWSHWAGCDLRHHRIANKFFSSLVT